MDLTYDNIIDDLTDWCAAHNPPVRVVGRRPDDGEAFALIWLGGGSQEKIITAQITVNIEVWWPRTAATSDGDAERAAEQLRSLISRRRDDKTRQPRVVNVTWPGFPANLPPDGSQAEQWARIVFMAAVEIRGRLVHP
ncbi:MAG: hypothetical protein ACTHXG_14435 [Micrococcaceae bacterium]